MSIHNVTPTHVDHLCEVCGQQTTKAHSEVEQVQPRPGMPVVLVLTCPQGHRYCLNNALEPEEETSPTRDEAGREQVRNVRALHRALGLPVK